MYLFVKPRTLRVQFTNVVCMPIDILAELRIVVHITMHHAEDVAKSILLATSSDKTIE
jgi:hypothetical protein